MIEIQLKNLIKWRYLSHVFTFEIIFTYDWDSRAVSLKDTMHLTYSRMSLHMIYFTFDFNQYEKLVLLQSVK